MNALNEGLEILLRDGGREPSRFFELQLHTLDHRSPSACVRQQVTLSQPFASGNVHIANGGFRELATAHEEVVEGSSHLENEIHARRCQRAGLANDGNCRRIPVGIAEPDDEFSEVCWRCCQHVQLALCEKAVIPQQPGAICLHRRWSAVRRHFPIQKLFGIRDEIVVAADQVIHPSPISHIGCYHSERFACLVHVTTSTHILFVSSLVLELLKNMILTRPNSSEEQRCYRCSQRE